MAEGKIEIDVSKKGSGRETVFEGDVRVNGVRCYRFSFKGDPRYGTPADVLLEGDDEGAKRYASGEVLKLLRLADIPQENSDLISRPPAYPITVSSAMGETFTPKLPVEGEAA